MKKIFGLLVIVLFLTLLGDKLSSAIHQFQGNSYLRSFEILSQNFLIICFINLFLYSFEMWRLKIIGKIFKQDFAWKDCFGGIAINLLFGWISPMSILGAPAMAWYLYKRGYPLVESISVSFVRSFTIIFVSAMTTITIYTFNLQGQIHNEILQEKVFQVLFGIAVYILSLIVLSYLPFKFVKSIKVIDKVTTQIRILLSEGKLLMVPVLCLTLILNFLLVSLIMYEGAKYHFDYGTLLGQVMLFLSYMLLMPTPGASGLAEVGAPLIFSSEIPRNEIISIVTAMRISTLGIQVCVGMLFIIFVMKERINFDEIRLFKKQNS